MAYCLQVSIGNFGNKAENDNVLGTSMTYPQTAMFDGESYYYLAFESRKPSLELFSEWEDIDYRYTWLSKLGVVMSRKKLSFCI